MRTPSARLRCVWLCAWLALAACSREPWVEGRVEVNQFQVASKYPGRLAQLYVKEGDPVEAGQLLLRISSPEVDAKGEGANALVNAAKAEHEKAQAGTRPQEIKQAQAAAAAAHSQQALADVTYERMKRLFEEGVISRQRFDEAAAARDEAHQASVGADALLSMARAGVRKQDMEVTVAMVNEAESKRQEAEAALAGLQLKSNVNGQVVQRLLEEGEIVAPGYPILVIARLDDAWVSFNLREDKLRNLQIGDTLSGRVPALNDTNVELRVYYISALGDFATWNSTRDLGSFDLRTFEVRARPTTALAGLRPGMTVLVAGSSFGRR